MQTNLHLRRRGSGFASSSYYYRATSPFTEYHFRGSQGTTSASPTTCWLAPPMPTSGPTHVTFCLAGLGRILLGPTIGRLHIVWQVHYHILRPPIPTTHT